RLGGPSVDTGLPSARLRHHDGLRAGLAGDGVDRRAALVAAGAAFGYSDTSLHLWMEPCPGRLSAPASAGVYRPAGLRPDARARRLGYHLRAQRDRHRRADRPWLDPRDHYANPLYLGDVLRFHLRSDRRGAWLYRRDRALAVRGAADLAGAGDRGH